MLPSKSTVIIAAPLPPPFGRRSSRKYTDAECSYRPEGRITARPRYRSTSQLQ